MQLLAEDRAMQIKKYGNKAVSAFPIGWTKFYLDSSPHLKYIVLDTFHATRILALGATQFQKITTQSKKSISVNYSNDD